jgi:hypothetical protein
MLSCGVRQEAASYRCKVGTLAGVLRQADVAPEAFINALRK